MSTANTFSCPTCGAALQVTGAELEVKCQYCGNVVVVPDALRHANPSGPHVYQAGQVPPEALEVLQQVVGELGNAQGQRYQPPQTYQPYQPMTPAQPAARSRRRGGCGCFGCLSFIAVLLIIVLIVLGVFVAVAPGQINQVLTQVNNAVQPAVADIGSFSVAPNLVSSNGIVIFNWAVNSTSNTVIRLDRVVNGSSITLLPSLPSIGTYSLAVQGKPGDKITFKLISTRNGVSTEKSVVVTIK